MNRTTIASKSTRRRGLVTALVVGAALSTFGAVPAEGAVRDVSRYCTACWRNARIQPDQWPDCTQEVLTRLVERVPPQSWERLLAKESEEHREFVRAIDAVKKRTQRAHRPSVLPGDVADPTHPERAAREAQRRGVLQAAAEHLSPRQARIIALSLDGWSVHEIADDVELRPARVSDEKYKAIQRLREVLTTA
jgi:RNA polymerase sigma factor (sigma-70 family)